MVSFALFAYLCNINLGVSTLLICSSVKTVLLRMNNGLARAALPLQWTSWLRRGAVLFHVSCIRNLFYHVRTTKDVNSVLCLADTARLSQIVQDMT